MQHACALESGVIFAHSLTPFSGLMTISFLCIMISPYSFRQLLVKFLDTFLELLEPYILKDMLGSLPPEVTFVQS